MDRTRIVATKFRETYFRHVETNILKKSATKQKAKVKFELFGPRHRANIVAGAEERSARAARELYQ